MDVQCTIDDLRNEWTYDAARKVAKYERPVERDNKRIRYPANPAAKRALNDNINGWLAVREGDSQV